jgi:hypothetical protein
MTTALELPSRLHEDRGASPTAQVKPPDDLRVVIQNHAASRLYAARGGWRLQILCRDGATRGLMITGTRPVGRNDLTQGFRGLTA